MREYFLRMYRYNQWANQTYLDHLGTLKTVPERVMVLFSHVLTAQNNWLNRIKEVEHKPMPIWDFKPLEELKELAKINAKLWLDYLERSSEEELQKTVHYINMQGIEYNNLVADIMMQVANHGTYHRAQFAILLRQANIAPPNTDYITYTRVISKQPIYS